MKYKIQINESEFWWGGSASGGPEQPYSRESRAQFDFRVDCPNQTMPLLLSSDGRFIWSDEPFAFAIHGGIIELDGENVTVEQAGSTLRDAYLAASRKHFPIDGKQLPDEFFVTAQYNTWMQFTYFPTQENVLAYAHAIVDNGFKPGILIIDEGWHGRYGIWEFDRLAFPDPKAMIDELHGMGFTVMLWVTPMVTADGLNFVRAAESDYAFGDEYAEHFLRNDDGSIAVTHWWNGYSAILNMLNPADVEFLDTKLQALIRDFGVDGFKFDGGKVETYHNRCIINGKQTKYSPHELNIAWNSFGERYKFHEYKDTYRGGGKAVIQRIRDRDHSWDGEGLSTVIPYAITEGLIGHPFLCPDMIGGGSWVCRFDGTEVDQELFVRMAQASALFPMMQFSWAPWEALDEIHLSYVRNAAALHCDNAEKLISLVRDAEKTGEPILRTLEYNYPHAGYAEVHNMFMLGDDILVCPVLEKGQRQREIRLPEGKWRTDDGMIFEGTHVFDAPLSKLLYFIRVK